jgi:hypothetical protein
MVIVKVQPPELVVRPCAGFTVMNGFTSQMSTVVYTLSAT